MDRINGQDWIDIGGGLRGFRDENNNSGIAGTEVTARWLNDVQEELLFLIETAGLTPEEAANTLLARAVRSFRLNNIVAGGTANALTAALTPAIADWAEIEGTPLIIYPALANTTWATLSLNGLAARTIFWQGRTLWAGAIKLGSPMIVVPMGGACHLLNPAPMAPGKQVYNTAGSYTFVVPAGVYVLDYAVIGGGGRSGYTTPPTGTHNHSEGGGGGGGAYGRMAVTPNQSIAVVVGAAGGRAGPIGQAGGTSAFGAISATGGGATAQGASGAGGAGIGGDINFAGGDGYNGDDASSAYGASGGDGGGPMGGCGSQGGSAAGWPGGGGWSMWRTDASVYFETPAAAGGVILQWGGGIQ